MLSSSVIVVWVAIWFPYSDTRIAYEDQAFSSEQACYEMLDAMQLNVAAGCLEVNVKD